MDQKFYESFCVALESLTPDETFSVHSECQKLIAKWDDGLESVVRTKMRHGEMTVAAESLLDVSAQIGMPLQLTATFEQFSERAAMLAQMQSAIETRCNDLMDRFDNTAATEAETLFDWAMESVIDYQESGFDAAMEGANLQTISMLKKHYSDTRALRKEMLAFKKQKDWENAAKKATEIARMSDQLCKDLEALPESTSSAAIVTIVLALAAIAAATAAATVGSKVGAKVGTKIGEPIAKETGEKVKREVFRQEFDKRLDTETAAIRAKYTRKPVASAAGVKRSGILNSVIGAARNGVKNVQNEVDRQQKIGKAVDAARAKVGRESVAAANAAARAKSKEVLDPYIRKGKIAGAAAGAATVGVPEAIATLRKAIKGKKIIDENGNPKKVPLSANEWNALIAWGKSVAKDMKKKYLELAATYRARIVAKEAFQFYMEAMEPAIESYIDEYAPAMEGVNIETLDIWKSHNKKISKVRKEMKYASEAGNPKIAAEKAREICDLCDETMQMLEKLPQSAMSMLLPKIVILTIVALIGFKVGPWIGEAGGKYIGRNMARAASQDLPKFMGKPLEEVTGRFFGIGGAFLPGIAAFKQLMAFLKGKQVLTAKGVVNTRLEPNEVNMLMNMFKSSIRSCKRKYDELAKVYDKADAKNTAEKTALSKGEESEFIHDSTLIALEQVIYEEFGYRQSAFDDFIEML